MGNAEIPKWLKGLPFAPEFRPTDTEFADPIAYISKIEKEASVYGICKVIPPLPKPSKRYVFANLNKTLSKCPEFVEGVDLSNVGPSPVVGSHIGDSGNDVESRAVFTTRQQELGKEVKRVKGMVKESPSLGAHKQVWQSGEVYTLEQFESKSKAFARSLLGLIKDANPLVVEALFWKAASEKPIFIEYANDVPGSGFGEPEGQFQYFSKQRRKRASYQSYRRHTEILNCKKKEMSRVNNFQNDEVDEGTVNNDQDMSLETTPSLRVTSSTLLSEETVRSSKRRSVNVSSDMEGTAGWKLANSLWNLQVIARSPGSLTRFMPDDIPGVTSPMVYIGMLFSWFAWHVEDHELHSLNFMHTGSSKTWYAVPGDYAFAFEEVVRTKAYGGKIDRLAALIRLGEKTTLLSPETVVSSGIPCCRLVQNPGEFVVTFPRAYHVGFSHGFNCGEAANFGTSQWLEVAKEAAVRRAAMNYLPMLSHQQLLYLLTMSFVSRVPRSLLPGARSSRLRDRQREERELSVKKAFIEDMSRENDILSVLLEKDSCYNVVMWNPDLLPCASKEAQLPSASIQTSQKESASSSHLDCDGNSIETDLFKEMSLYMESLNGLYVDNDDLSCDFQCDSGTLACVACGILGFPFMSVVQPSERASLELFPRDQLLLGDVTRSDTGRSSTESNSTLKSSVAGDRSPEHDFSLPQNDLPVPKQWNTSSKVLRPRIFCLEHGVQIEELLQSKGGANMLIICHSDFQKMKAHATAIAEEIEHPFKYNEVPLENASQKDLNLIDLAIDVEDHDECGEDWTSKLGINLRYCVKVRKNSPSKKVHHALALGGLFSDETPSSRFLNINWQSRRSRSRIILSEPSQCKLHDNVERNEKLTDIKSEGTNVKKGKLIQYSRRKRKVKTEVSVANFEDLHKHAFDISVIIGGGVGIIGTGSSASGFSSTGNSEMLHEAQLLEGSRNTSLSSPSPSPHVITPLPHATELVKRIVGPIDGQPLEESDKHNICDVTCGFSEAKCDAEATKGSSSCVTGVDICEAQECEQNLKIVNAGNETSHVVSDGQFDFLLSRDVLMNEGSELAYPESLDPFGPIIRQKEIEAKNKSCRNNEYDHVTLDSEVQQELHTSSRNSVDNSPTCIDTLVNQTPVLMEEIREHQQQASAAEDEVQQEINSASISNEKQLLPSSSDLLSQPLVSVNGCSGTHGEPFNLVNQCNSVTVENDVQLVNQAVNKLKGLDVSLTLSEMDIDQCSLASVEKVSELLAGTSAEEDLCSGSTLDVELLQESSTPKMCADLSVKVLGHSMPFSVEKCSEVPRGNCAAGDLSTDVNLSTEIQQEIHSTDEMTRDDGASKVQQGTSLINDDELLTTQSTQIIQPMSGIIVGRDSIAEEGAHPVENMANGKEESSTGELMTTEPTVVDSRSRSGKSRKRKNELELITESELRFQGFIRSPCEGLRPRGEKETTNKSSVDVEKSSEDNPVNKRARKPSVVSAPRPSKEITKKPHKCNLEGCRLSFVTKAELVMHKRYQCTYEGCKKRFGSHKYAIIHQRVHEDDRPLKCPWKGCSLSFKWAWARTEHIRVHTGEKPYQCKVEGCGLSFRFVSDYSRHRRKTGHYVNSDA